MKIEIETIEESRPHEDPFGCLIVNGRHIWRFDRLSQAEGAADNLRKALADE